MVLDLPPTRCVAPHSRVCHCSERQTRSDGSPLASVRVPLALTSSLLLPRPPTAELTRETVGCRLAPASSGVWPPAVHTRTRRLHIAGLRTGLVGNTTSKFLIFDF